jgi:hypothetical protein
MSNYFIYFIAQKRTNSWSLPPPASHLPRTTFKASQSCPLHLALLCGSSDHSQSVRPTPTSSKCLPFGMAPVSEICSRSFIPCCPPASRYHKRTRMLLLRGCSGEAIPTSIGTQFGKVYLVL